MVSNRYFFDVCEAGCWKRTPLVEVTSTNLPETVAFAAIDGEVEAAAFCCAYNHHEQESAHAITSTRSMVLEK